ncbi:MAG TPA: ChbG/HpnK family deacetylase [Solimonas sp.]
MSAVPRPLIVNADDFGLVPEVNAAIVDAHCAGAVTSTTLMVNMAGFADAVAQAQANPALGVGLHFNLTLGRPLSPAATVRSLVDADGVFHPRTTLALRLLGGRVRRDEIAIELAAQFACMRDAGLTPTHLDSHQHTHGFPAVFDAVAALCEREGLPLRMPWLLALAGQTPGPGRRLRQWLLGRMLARNARVWRGRVRWNDGLGSLFDLGTLPADPALSDYARVLTAAPAGVFELMVHPVRGAAAVDGLTRIGELGDQERMLLSTPGLRKLAGRMGFVMCSYRDAFATTNGTPKHYEHSRSRQHKPTSGGDRA